MAVRNASNEVVIVGGGLVGSLLAATLARRGHAVDVYEQRDDPRHGPTEGGRSINLVLTRRGIRGLERAGLADGALALTVPVTGRMIHASDGTLSFQPYGRDETECNHSVSRAALNAYLIGEAERRGVRLHYGARLVELDPDSHTATFARKGAAVERLEIRGEVILGADGAGSAVREALVRQGRFVERTDLLDHGYKELTLPATADGGFRIAQHALHIWPRGESMLMALPNRDGSFTVTLYLPQRGPRGFEALADAKAVRRLFAEQFADAIPLIPDLVTDFFANPSGSLGTVRTRPWHDRDRVLLIGDAAHAIVPFFGQGMNAGFEDCTVLGQLLDAPDHAGWGQVFEAFDRVRKPDADAIADLALENFVEMRDRVGDARFLLRKRVEHRLELEFPREYRSRYSMVMYSHIPFHLAQEAGTIQERILEELCAGLEDPGELDLTHARALVRERLAPFLARHAIGLDY